MTFDHKRLNVLPNMAPTIYPLPNVLPTPPQESVFRNTTIRPELKPFTVDEAVAAKPDAVKRCEL